MQAGTRFRSFPLHEGRFVDESLFGESAASKLLKAKQTGRLSSAGRATLDAGAGAASGHGATRGGLGRSSSPIQPTYVGGNEYATIRQRAAVAGGEDEDAWRARAADEAARKKAVAEARKERMRSLETARIASIPKTQLEQEEEEERNRRRTMAREVGEERLDDMKVIQSLSNYAITVSIRERQLREKKEREAAERAAERMLELEMEIRALEQQKKADEVEAVKKAHQHAQRAVVLDQLESALRKKREERDRLKAEGVAAAAEAKRRAEEEAAAKAEERRRQAAILADTLAANQANIAAKTARRDAEREAERRADEEAAAILAKQLALEEQREEIRKEKERLLHLAAGQVQKFQDDRAAKDELRARRDYEAGLRAEREKELQRARQRAAMLADLARARATMAEEKQVRVAEAVEGERAEYERAMRVQEQWLAREREADAARSAANAAHLKALQAQMKDREEMERRAREAERAAEDARRAAAVAELEHLRGLRDSKVAALRELGVDPLFTAQLQRYDPQQAQVKKELQLRMASGRGSGKEELPAGTARWR